MAVIAEIPKFGLGTALDIGDGEKQVSEIRFKQMLERALRIGVRHIDCSPMYGTQELVGRCLRERTTDVARSDLFISSNIPPNMTRDENMERSLKATLRELQVNYLDLLVLAAPFATKFITPTEPYPVDLATGDVLLDDEDKLLERAWSKMFDLKARGFVKYIGVANVNMEQIVRLHELHPIDVVQNEYHMFHQNREIFDHCDDNDIHFEAYAPFGSPQRAHQMKFRSILTDELVNRVAQKYNLTRGQVVIQWLHKQPLSYVLACDNVTQLDDNWNATESVIVQINDLMDLDQMNRNQRIYDFAQHKGLDKHREFPWKGPPPPLPERI